MAKQNKFTTTITLAAGVAQDVDIPMYGCSRWALVIKNTGSSNAIGTTVVKKLPLESGLVGTDAATGTAIGSIAANGSSLVTESSVSYSTLRLTLTSSSGTTCQIDFMGSGGIDA